MKPKMRIQKLSPEGVLESDRLVDQYSELLQGPQEPHRGTVKLEITLEDEKNLEEIKQYLDKLVGLIDIGVPKVRRGPAGRPTEGQKSKPMPINQSEVFLAKVKAAQFQEDVITLFKREKFVILSKTLSDDQLGTTIRDKDKDFNFWAKRTDTNIDPKLDTYDWSLIIGLKYIGQKVGKIVLYTPDEFLGFVKKPWKVDSSINFKVKKKGTKFPYQMTLDERKNWRTYDKKIRDNKELKNSQRAFYLKWTPEIEKLNVKKERI